MWTKSRFLIALVAGMACAAPAMADVIRWGYGGSIFGGSTWEVRPNDTVVYAAYQATGAITERPEWVWDDADTKTGHITFAIDGAFAVASGIVTRRIKDAGLGPALAYRSSCSDAGLFTIEAELDGFAYAAMLDACLPNTTGVPPAARAQYDALLATTAEISTALRLDRLFNP